MKDPTPSPTITFVVPTRNSIRTIEQCLKSILSQDYESCELIVVDNDSVDGTRELAATLATKVVSHGPERSAQRNEGARLASGQYVVFIDSDMYVSTSVAAEIGGSFRHSNVHALVIPERVVGEGFWSKCRQIEKKAYLGDEAVEAARAFRVSTFRQLGGYDERLTGPEDWELPDRLRRAGYAAGRISAFVDHDERPLGIVEAFQKKRYYGRSFMRFVRMRSHPIGGRMLRRSLLKPLLEVPRQPVHVLGLYLLKSAELLGLAVGMIESRWRRDNVY